MKSYAEARKYMHTLGLKSTKDWQEYARSGKRPADIPSNPSQTYKGEFKGVPDWLGYNLYAGSKNTSTSTSDGDGDGDGDDDSGQDTYVNDHSYDDVENSQALASLSAMVPANLLVADTVPSAAGAAAASTKPQPQLLQQQMNALKRPANTAAGNLAKVTRRSVESSEETAASDMSTAETTATTSAGASAAGGPKSSTAAQIDGKLPVDWAFAVDSSSQRNYYYNRMTRFTTWEFPTAEVDKKETAKAAKAANAANAANAAAVEATAVEQSTTVGEANAVVTAGAGPAAAATAAAAATEGNEGKKTDGSNDDYEQGEGLVEKEAEPAAAAAESEDEVTNVAQPCVYIDSAKFGNYARFANDYRSTKRKHNAHFIVLASYSSKYAAEKPIIWLESVADIAAGDEVLVDYGDSYWDNFDAGRDGPKNKRADGGPAADPWENIFFTNLNVTALPPTTDEHVKQHCKYFHAINKKLGNQDGSPVEHDLVEVQPCPMEHPAFGGHMLVAKKAMKANHLIANYSGTESFNEGGSGYSMSYG